MLEQLLALLSTGSLMSTAQLARHLGVGLVLVEQMLADLVRAGYLQEVPATCSTGCGICASRAACARPRMWMHTAKFPANR